LKREKIRELVNLMEELGIDEFEYRSFFKRIKIVRSRKNESMPIAQAPPQKSTPIPETQREPQKDVSEVEEEKALETFPIKSPLVGTFYRAPAPGAEPFVREGDFVEPGQVVAIVEAMKVMNEIEAERRGKVVKILVGDGEPVEYGQDLMLLAPL